MKFVFVKLKPRGVTRTFPCYEAFLSAKRTELFRLKSLERLTPLPTSLRDYLLDSDKLVYFLRYLSHSIFCYRSKSELRFWLNSGESVEFFSGNSEMPSHFVLTLCLDFVPSDLRLVQLSLPCMGVPISMEIFDNGVC